MGNGSLTSSTTICDLVILLLIIGSGIRTFPFELLLDRAYLVLLEHPFMRDQLRVIN